MRVGAPGGLVTRPEGGRTLRDREGSFAALFRELERRFQLPPGLVGAVARAESGLNPRAVSPAGALGLMQLLPSTAWALGVEDPFDPVQNAEAGARYLRQLLERFHGDVRLALAAYNAGPGAVERYGGIPPYAETRAYVKKVLAFLEEERTRGGGPASAGERSGWVPAPQASVGEVSPGGPPLTADDLLAGWNAACSAYVALLLAGAAARALAGPEADVPRDWLLFLLSSLAAGV